MTFIHQFVTRQFVTRLASNKQPLRRAKWLVFGAALSLALTALYFLPTQLSGIRAAAVVQNSVAVTSVSAASFVGSPAALAPNSITAAFGTQLANGTQVATTQPLPTSLLNTSVTVNGVAAQLFFVSPGQVNYLIPPNTTAGDAQVVITAPLPNGDQMISRGQVRISPAAPAIFTANSNGAGVPAAVTGRVNAAGQFVFDANPPYEPDPATPGVFVPAPIDVGTTEQPAFVILFGTGLRNSPANSVRAIIGGLEVPVTPVPAPGFTGLDQVNVQIPVSLKGRGNVDLSVVAAGAASNTVTVNLAGTPNNNLTITNFSVTEGALAGQTITITGNGFSPTANQNTVRFGSAQGRVISATANQLTVIVPFGAESGRVAIQTPQGEARSTANFRVRTSISGLVQSTGTTTAPPAPLEGVTIRVAGTNITARTTPQGSFVIPDLPVGLLPIEVDGGTNSSQAPFPRISLKVNVRGDRDNQFPQPISLQQIVGGSGTVGQGLAGEQLSAQHPLWRETVRQQQFAANPEQAITQQLTPAKNVVITDRGVTLEVPIGTNVRFPDGKTNGQVQLTVVQRSRLPGIALPLGVYAPVIAQITPFGAEFSPGASLSFPNPDQANLAPGAKVDLYRYDFQSATFIRRGSATVSTDRTRIVSDGRVVDVGSFWLATAPTNITTVWGRVIDSLGLPVAGAHVTINGRFARSDVNGGYSIPDVATNGVTQLQAEAVLPQQFGVVPRGTSALSAPVVGGVTNMGTIALSDTNQPGLVLAPFLLDFASNGAPARVELSLTQPAPAGGLSVTLTSALTSVATVPANVTIPAGQTTTSFNVTRVGAGASVIEARATLSGNTLTTYAVVTVSRAAPTLTTVSPTSAPSGARITISGTGLSAIPDNNLIGFSRNGQLVALIDPDENTVVLDNSGRPALRVIVPPLPPGAVSIVAAVVDNLTGIISDASAPLNFTVTASNVTTPQLASVSPGEGRPRDQITINGTGFSIALTENAVVFRQGLQRSEARVLRASATQLTVEVPSQNIERGPATIVVRRIAESGASSANSNALDFNITAEAQRPVKPSLATVANTTTGAASGRDGDTIRLQGTGFGRNFYNPETDDAGNDEPLITLLLFYQGTQLVNFAVPIGAANGTQLTAVVPSGLAQGATLITAFNFDLETGFFSDESAPLNFTVTSASLRRVDEDEPNDSPRTATEVFLQTVVDGNAAKGDYGELVIRFNDGTAEILVDLFDFSVDIPTALTFTLNFTQTADLDLFVLQSNGRGGYDVIANSTNNQGVLERITGTVQPGKFLIAVGSFNGSSRYTLELRQGTATASFAAPLLNFRQPLTVESLSDNK